MVKYSSNVILINDSKYFDSPVLQDMWKENITVFLTEFFCFFFFPLEVLGWSLLTSEKGGWACFNIRIAALLYPYAQLQNLEALSASK